MTLPGHSSSPALRSATSPHRMRWTAPLLALLIGAVFAACDAGGNGATAPDAGRAPGTATIPATTPASEPTTAASPSPAASPEATPEATGTPDAQPTTQPNTQPTGSSDARPVALRAVGNRAWQRPVEVGAYPHPSGQASLFVVEQEGTVWALPLDAANGNATLLLDISARVSRGANEEGLLSMALDPAFEENRHVWLYYSATGPRRSVISRFEHAPDAPEIDPASELVVLEVEQPFGNHNGGALRFGPDGMLYLGYGDGGSGGDPEGHGQDLGTLLGSIIRIDVRNASEAAPYAIPPDNPFVGRADARDEIWAYGQRNPWRSAFDSATGALWSADVGQNAVEEVNIIERGGNYGWNIMEGDRCYRPSSGCDETGLTMPVLAYDRSEGRCSVTGGVVYRGSSIPEIAGNYLFGDLCSGDVWAIRADDPGDAIRVLSGLTQLTSFGVDATGEVYVVAFGQPVRQIVSP